MRPLFFLSRLTFLPQSVQASCMVRSYKATLTLVLILLVLRSLSVVYTSLCNVSQLMRVNKTLPSSIANLPGTIVKVHRGLPWHCKQQCKWRWNGQSTSPEFHSHCFVQDDHTILVFEVWNSYVVHIELPSCARFANAEVIEIGPGSGAARGESTCLSFNVWTPSPRSLVDPNALKRSRVVAYVPSCVTSGAVFPSIRIAKCQTFCTDRKECAFLHIEERDLCTHHGR